LVKYANTALDGDDVCFDVTAELRDPVAFMFIAVFMIGFVNATLMALHSEAIKGKKKMLMLDEKDMNSSHEDISGELIGIDKIGTTTLEYDNKSITEPLILASSSSTNSASSDKMKTFGEKVWARLLWVAEAVRFISIHNEEA
jgi:hypothetical protein